MQEVLGADEKEKVQQEQTPMDEKADNGTKANVMQQEQLPQSVLPEEETALESEPKEEILEEWKD